MTIRNYPRYPRRVAVTSLGVIAVFRRAGSIAVTVIHRFEDGPIGPVTPFVERN